MALQHRPPAAGDCSLTACFNLQPEQPGSMVSDREMDGVTSEDFIWDFKEKADMKEDRKTGGL